MTKVLLTEKIPAELDALVVAATTQDDKATLLQGAGLDKKAVASLETSLAQLKFTGAKDSTTVVTGIPGIDAPVTVIGLGEEVTTEGLRRGVGAAFRGLLGTRSVAVLLPFNDAELVGAAAEAVHYGSYTYTAQLSAKKAKKADAAPETVSLVTVGAGEKDAERALQRADVLGRQVAYARDLVNTPPNVLYPETFAASVTKHAGKDLKVTVHDENKLAELGAGLILGVGLGSSKPPRIVEMSYSPKGAEQHIAYVGKGVTFDSGGLCLKPGGSMVTMKCDMGGAAAVAGAMLAIAELELPIKVTAYLCLVENMTGPDAQRPGDVVTAIDGTTVEIINTDAEGRLAMADGICLAAQTDAELIVDIATLTGAAIGALGNRTAAVLGSNDEIRTEVMEAARRMGENFWPIPIVEEIRPAMKSDVADLKHTGGKVGGMMTAGRFLQEFVGTGKDGNETTWAHLDIAGPAFVDDSAWGYYPKGGTGFGVRTLVGLAEDRAGR